ncbi:MAG: glycosyltransferase family 9 protein [Muribaculaceae bacterium]|nr:glycosyltransferase family 9 protein [Muribaculaceae bacterium]MBR5673576.1 glycosyltransferase family 9 protein [Muribaculaceae bacterium]
MAKSDDSPRNVLVMRLSALGDVAMTIPVLYPVCRANPDTSFIMLTKKWPASMFHDRPDNLMVVGIDVKSEYKGALGLMKLASQLRKKYEIDAVADLHNVLRSWVIGLSMKLHGIPVVRLDKQRARRKALITHKSQEPVTPTIERYRNVFLQLGLEAPDEFSRLYDGKPLPDSPIVPAKEPGHRWIAVSPFSAHEGKVYPLELMTQVVAQLVERDNYRVFLMGGGKTEKIALRKMAGKNKRIISMAEIKHGFIDEYALLGKCDLMLTMDSANMHLASVMGLKTVTIWGATAPACGFQGYGQDGSDDIQLDMPCRPCSIYGERQCRFGDYRCLSGITPDEVVERVIATIEGK